MDLTKVIIRPLVTEKAYQLKQLNVPKFSFVVNKKATKLQIRDAFKAIFGVMPEAVNTILRKPQPTRFSQKGKHGYTKLIKIAYITLPKGVSIDLDDETAKPTEEASTTKGDAK